MDKSWMKMWRGTVEYIRGVEAFLSFAVSNSTTKELIVCPCKKCRFRYKLHRDEVYDHLIGLNGIVEGYTDWIWHGEKINNHDLHRGPMIEGSSSGPINKSRTLDHEGEMMHDMLNDAFQMHNSSVDDGGCEIGMEGEPVGEEQEDGDHDCAKKFYDLLKDANNPLHDNTKHSKLGAIVHLYNMKCMGGWSNTIFTSLLEFINQLLGTDKLFLPNSTYEAKKYMKDLGLGYEKIPACRDGCMIFWKETENLAACTVCGKSKWKDDIIGADGSSQTSKRRPVKVLRYFPLIPRLQRLFTSQHTASHMKWHAHARTKDGVLRHPADGEAWKSFDARHPDFASDPRNVRLGLASDGFNPFGNMSSSHSTWPVMLVPYNLPPWLCMKHPYFILSMIIRAQAHLVRRLIST
ncbi:hypothetical protein SLA2020_397670 [Shorea laevis]